MARSQRSRGGRADRPRRRRTMLPAGVPADDTWQVAREQMATEVEDDAGAPHRPWLTIIVGEHTGLALATDMQLRRPAAADVLKVIGQAIKKPMIGRPHKPRRVVCAERELSEEIEPGLAALSVECATGETPQVVEVLAELTGFLDARQPIPGLLDMPGVTPDLVERLFEASAAFYRRAPWRLAPADAAIAVRVPAVSDTAVYVVLIGQAGMVPGFAVYRTPEALQLALTSADPQVLAQAGQEGFTFGPAEETPEADVAAVEEHGWEIAGPDAYPAPLIVTPTGEFRRPSATDVEWYEAILWTLPDFVETHLDRALQTGEVVEAEMRAVVEDRELVAIYRFPPTIRRRTGRRRSP